MRTKAERRKRDFKKAIRKKHIAEQHGYSMYDNLHQYSKNKIHCSCPMCAAKTNMNSKDTMSHSDKIKVQSMDNQIDELNHGEE